MGVTAESSVMPTVTVALSAYHALSPAVIDSGSKQSLQDEERPWRPKLKIISAPKAEIRHKTVAYKECSH